MSKSTKVTIGIVMLAASILTLGADRIFVAADTGAFVPSMTDVTVIALILFLVAAIWLFKAFY